MSGDINKPQSERELKTARALNTVATIGAGHALYSMTPEKHRLKIREGMLKVAPHKIRPNVERSLNALKQPELGGKLGTAGKVVAGGWLALHSGELAGDILARRSINRQLQQSNTNEGKVNSVHKNDQSMISKAEGSVSRNGHGKNLSDKYLPGTIAATAGGIGTGLNAQYARQARGSLKDLNRGKAALNYSNLEHVASERERLAGKAKLHGNRTKLAAILTAAGVGEMAVSHHNKNQNAHNDVMKAYRRFDPEADRQRRLGLYAGTGVGGAVVAGREASKHFKTKALDDKGKVLARGLFVKPGQGKKALALSAITAGSGAVGVGSYKRGLSVRNNPYT